MEVTAASGVLTIDPNDGATAPVILNAATIIRFEPIKGAKYIGGVASTDPAAPYEASAGYTSTDQWKIVVVMNDRAIDLIRLGQVTNHNDWANTLLGAQTALTALSAVFA